MSQTTHIKTATDSHTTADFGDTDPESRGGEMENTVSEWVEELIEAIQDARGTEHFQEWLDAASAFHDYSVRNQLLIKLQKPDATRVAGYNTWKNEFDRHVKKGESGIYIWRPKTITAYKCPHCGNAPNYHIGNDDLSCPRADSHPDEWDVTPSEEWDRGSILIGFTQTTVFDVSQTEGEPLPELDHDTKAGDCENPDELVTDLIAAGDALGMDVALVDPAEWTHSGKGYCDPNGNTPTVRAKDRDPAATAGTLIHELAHGLLHHGDETPAEAEKREVEAEAAAYLAGRRLGCDMSGSAFYLASWTDDEAEVIRSRLKRISSTANEIVETVTE